MSSHEKELPRMALAIFEFCKPSSAIRLRYWLDSTRKANRRTIIAVVATLRFKKDFKKQYIRITTRKSPK
jgi:hypothetical protein